ncbi:unnamed protein product [Prunus armeniaca]
MCSVCLLLEKPWQNEKEFHQLIYFRKRDLLDISPTLTEAAGAIIDVSMLLKALKRKVKAGLHKAIYSSPLRLGLGGGVGESPNASSSNKGWPGQCGVHLPGLARRQGEPELHPKGS